MAVKKGILDNFLKPSSHYSDNQKSYRSIFIDKSEDDLKPEPENFFESTILGNESTLLTSSEQTIQGLISSLPSSEHDKTISQIETITDPNSISDENHNLRQTKDKLETNLSKTRDKHKTNLGQTKDKVETNQRQTKDKPKSQLETKLETKTGRENLRHTWDKLETREISERLEHLSDLKKNVLLFVYKECQSVLDSKTARLTIDYVAGVCKARVNSVRKIIQRLEDEGILSRPEYKDGRGGWTIYELHKKIYDVINGLENSGKLETILRQAKKLETELKTELKTNASSSSSVLNIKETTTTELSDEWNFDITLYARFGFTSTQLKQVASLGVVSAADVEQSLIEFSYDLDNNALPPIKTTKINFLMGLLRAGHAYVSEGFKNEQDAMIAEMARREAVKREDRLKAKFEAWTACLTIEQNAEIEKQLPTHLMVLYRAHNISNPEVRNWLFNYYLQMKPQ